MYVVDTDRQKERDAMDSAVLREIEKLQSASFEHLRMKYRELFQEEPRSKHQHQLFRRIAWRMQALVEGELSERARQRASQIANDADLRLLPPRGLAESHFGRWRGRLDPRIPPPGTVLTREFRESTITVKILADGFEYQGRRYGSLSAIATEVTGTRWNGLAFFALTAERKNRKGRHASVQH
jgi:hypothetical protein